MADLPLLTGAEAGGPFRWEEGALPLKLQIFAARLPPWPSLQRTDCRWAQRRRQGGGPGIAAAASAGVKFDACSSPRQLPPVHLPSCHNMRLVS